MKRGHQTDKQTNKHTSQLLDQLGPEGRVGEKSKWDKTYNVTKLKNTKCDKKLKM